MKVFLSHAHEDKDVVEPIASWLREQGFKVWIDNWCLTPGDSLVNKISEEIESSDRLVVFLSATSVDSNWVQKEVASGMVMELAEDKGLGEKFVIPALLTPCKIPFFLRDKIYANFTDKAFEAACEELAHGIRDEPAGPQGKKLENRIFRHCAKQTEMAGRHGLVVEFAVRISPTEGLHIGIDVGAKYDEVKQWFGLPNNPTVPENIGGVFTNSAVRREPPIYARKFASPGISSTRSYYLYFEGPAPFQIREFQFLDYYDRIP